MRTRISLVIAVALAGCLAACTSGELPAPETTGASPFVVGAPPAEWGLRIAGSGTTPQQWSTDDSGDSEQPYTLLARPKGDKRGDIRVAATSYTGFNRVPEGDLGDAEKMSLDGDLAYYWKSAPPQAPFLGPFPDLLVVRAHDLALEVSGKGATRAELVAVARATKLSRDHHVAPTVAHPPHGLRVLGHVDSHLVSALHGYFEAFGGEFVDVPGDESTKSITWTSGGAQIIVMAIPGSSVDLDVAERSARATASSAQTVTHLDLRGEPGFEIDLIDHGVAKEIELVTRLPWGDVAVAVAHSGTIPTPRQLQHIVSSMRQVDEATWKEFVTKASGGPELGPDPEHQEFSRGRLGSTRWLLQTGEPGGPPRMGSSHDRVDPDMGHRADHCLKLSNHTRRCATDGGLTGDTAYETGKFQGQSFMIITTVLAAQEALIRNSDGEVVATVPLVRIAGANTRAGVVFSQAGPAFTCADLAKPRVDGFDRIELIGSNGKPVCTEP
jgi:hypothetical protein